MTPVKTVRYCADIEFHHQQKISETKTKHACWIMVWIFHCMKKYHQPRIVLSTSKWRWISFQTLGFDTKSKKTSSKLYRQTLSIATTTTTMSVTVRSLNEKDIYITKTDKCGVFGQNSMKWHKSWSKMDHIRVSEIQSLKSWLTFVIRWKVMWIFLDNK